MLLGEEVQKYENNSSKLNITSIPITHENQTGLQPVSRPVEQAHYFEGWVKGCKSPFCAKALNMDKNTGLVVAPY